MWPGDRVELGDRVDRVDKVEAVDIALEKGRVLEAVGRMT